MMNGGSSFITKSSSNPLGSSKFTIIRPLGNFMFIDSDKESLWKHEVFLKFTLISSFGGRLIKLLQVI